MARSQFKYTVREAPAGSGAVGKSYYAKQGLAKLFSSHSKQRTDLSAFAFYTPGDPNSKKKKSEGPHSSRTLHPLFQPAWAWLTWQIRLQDVLALQKDLKPQENRGGARVKGTHIP